MLVLDILIGKLNGNNMGRLCLNIFWIRMQLCSIRCGSIVIGSLLRVLYNWKNWRRRIGKNRKDKIRKNRNIGFFSKLSLNPMKNCLMCSKSVDRHSTNSFPLTAQYFLTHSSNPNNFTNQP
jgi:hypothetical protein